MTQPRPTTAELVEAVREFLTAEVAPALDGRLRFHAKVAANALAIVERELADGPAAEHDEGDRLRRLLAAAGAPTASDAGEPLDTEALARGLATLLRAGAIPLDDPALVDHLRRAARADVAIANPSWAADDRPAAGG
jgi:hypothetical protein